MAATVQRVFVCFIAARCCRCSSEEQSWSGGTGWVLRGYREYYWGTTGVVLEYHYSRCSPEEHSSIPLTANWKGSTSYRGQRHGIAMRLLGVALLSTAPVSTRKVFRVHLVAPNQSGCGDSMSGDDAQHEQEYAKTNCTGPKLPFRTTLPGYCQGAGMRGVSPDRKQGGQRMVRGRQRL